MMVMRWASVETPTDLAVAKALLAQFEHPESIVRNADQKTVGVADFGTGKFNRSIGFGKAELMKALLGADAPTSRYLLVDPFTIHLDGATRLSLSDRKPTADPRQFPGNHLMALIRDSKARKSLRSY
jgi:hypothetical protein